MQRLSVLAIVVGMVACGSKPAPLSGTPAPALGSASTASATAGTAATATPAAANTAGHAPELYPPAWTKVGVGQTVHFGTSVIDQDLDETAVDVTKLPDSASFDQMTQTITWTPVKADMPAATFEITIPQGSAAPVVKTWTIAVAATPQPAPVLAPQSAVLEELLLIHDPARLAAVNKEWPLQRLLEVGAKTFQLQFVPDKRALLTHDLDGATAYKQMLTGLSKTHDNARLDPTSRQFDKAAFGDPASWKIVAFRPRIDKQWAELRVIYKAMNAAEPVYAMFRLRPVVEYVPALPRPDEELTANNKIFLGMVAKRLMDRGGPSAALLEDPKAHGKAIAELMTDVMTFDGTQGPNGKPYLHGFEIGIALEARMGGGSARDGGGAYLSGDGWAWSAMKPFQTTTDGGKTQIYQNVSIPGFWTKTVASQDHKTWLPACAPRFAVADPAHVPGYEVLCRKTMGFVDLPAMRGSKVYNGTIDANNRYPEYKKQWMVDDHFALEDGRRDLGEENGMTCSQCHIRNFGMHDYHDAANVDPSAGTPKAPNHALPSLNFVIIPTNTWEPFTLEFVQHQECRGKANLTQYLGADAAKGLTCALAK